MNPIHSSPPVLKQQGPIATITLNRPQHYNRLHQEDLNCLLNLFDQINQNPCIRVLILTGHTNCPSSMFSAGFNTAEFNEDGHSNGHGFERVPDALEVLRPVTICALNGSVIGGATDLALACDIRWGVQGMHLKMPAAQIGLHFYPTGMRRYVTRWSLAMAQKAFLTAHQFSDQELLNSGFLDQLFPADRLMPEVDALAHRISQLAPLAIQGMKKSLHLLSSTSFEFERIAQLERQVNQSDDFKEGRLALKQRRPPLFTGN